ncbi:MAG: penicillin-binding protein activator, partial [Gammaproteobacteria bacterium]|nr:penicillin-binding protein activator [Gammaproteobacteria bacterium]
MNTASYCSRATLSLLFVLSGCSTTQIPPPREVSTTEQIELPVEQATTIPLELPQPLPIPELAAEPAMSAQEHLQLARSVASPGREEHLLEAARIMITQRELGQANSILEQLSLTPMSASMRARSDVLRAHIAVIQRNPNKALALLESLSGLANITAEVSSEILELKAWAELAVGRRMDAIKTLAQRERYTSDRKQSVENQQQLWHVLESSNVDELLSTKQTTTDPVLRGWLDLALIVIENSSDSYRLSTEINGWRRTYPAHPAAEELLSMFTSAAPVAATEVAQIALLLPLASTHGQAAQAVHDGFLAIHRANTDPTKPIVRVYDIGSEPALAALYYRLAVQEGADFVVGPLGKQAVESLVSEAQLSRPTLLLGTTPLASGLSSDIYQLGLQPEQEAEQVAERAYLDGHRIAAVLYPSDSWGQRMFSAFTTRWDQLGGVVAESQIYEPRNSDFSGRIKRLLNITGSETRKQTLQNTLATNLRFQPRRRQDIDLIFLAAQPQPGRLLKPQLNFYGAHDVPVYATSHIYVGKPDKVNDADLDGVIFGDMPWLLAQQGRISLLRQTIQVEWPNRNTPLDRLYALGLDAYNIIPQLNRLRADPSARYSGATAALTLAPDGRLLRRLQWARFENGEPIPIEQSIDYEQ